MGSEPNPTKKKKKLSLNVRAKKEGGIALRLQSSSQRNRLGGGGGGGGGAEGSRNERLEEKAEEGLPGKAPGGGIETPVSQGEKSKPALHVEQGGEGRVLSG